MLLLPVLPRTSGRSSSAATEGSGRQTSSSVIGGGGGSKRADAVAQRVTYIRPGGKPSRAVAAGS